MAYVQPDSNIYLLENVPLDDQYQHTIAWTGNQANVASQRDYFLSFSRNELRFTNQSYQRFNLGTIRIGCPIDALYDVNYLMFKNTHYSSKWFYAFVTDISYVNDNMTSVSYEIDVMQTWYFESDMGECMIERTTTASDYLFENTIPENIMNGTSTNLINNFTADYNDMCIVVMSTKYPTISQLPDIDLSGNVSPHVDKWNNARPIATNHVYTALEQRRLLMTRNLYQPETPNSSPEWPVDPNTDYVTYIQAFIQNGFEDYIVGIYQAPNKLWTNPDNQNNAGHPGVFIPPYTETFTVPLQRMFPYRKDPSTTGYTPKNRKLYNSPYCSLTISNNAGSVQSYALEEFYHRSNLTDIVYDVYDTTSYKIQFRAKGSFTTDASIILYPLNYLKVSEAWDFGITMTDFPQCAWVGDAFKVWWAQNKFSVGADFLGSAVQMVAGVREAVQGANEGRIVTQHIGEETATSGVVNVLKTIAKIQDAKNLPPTPHGVVKANYLMAETHRYQFNFYQAMIDGEYAELVDNFFSMYGYAYNRIETPSRNNRETWTYVKTVNAYERGSIPKVYANKIEQIYNKGVTFWKYKTSNFHIGDYTQSNTPNAEL